MEPPLKKKKEEGREVLLLVHESKNTKQRDRYVRYDGNHKKSGTQWAVI